MVYAKELAPNLFNTYHDWRQNYVNETGKEPPMEEAKKVALYFLERINGGINMKPVSDGYARERPFIKKTKESDIYNYCVTCGMAYSRKETQCPMCTRRNKRDDCYKTRMR